MTFYINQCSLQYKINDPELQLFRKIIFSVVIFELFAVLVLRIISGFKNYDLQMIRKGLEQKKKLQEKAIFQTIENLNLNGLLEQHNQTTITLICNPKLGTKNMKILKKQSININDIDTIALKKGVNKMPDKAKELKNIQSNSEQSNSSDQSEATQQNDENNQQLKKESPDDLEMLIEENKNFINVFNIKIDHSEASNFFNIILGHFFISAVLSLQQSPSIYSAIFCAFHALLFILLVLVNACVANTSNQVINQANQGQDTVKKDHERNPNEGLMIENNSEKQKKEVKICNLEKPEQRSVKSKISLLIMAFMLLLNLSLIMYSITQIKKSYFNSRSNDCQSQKNFQF